VSTAARRGFIGAAAGLSAAALVAPGVLLHSVAAAPRTEPVTGDVRWGLLIDTAKCADGCSACVAACERENGLDLQEQQGSASQWELQKSVWIRKIKLQDSQTGRITQSAPDVPTL
jgi:tetrathionate reductase subunit B